VITVYVELIKDSSLELSYGRFLLVVGYITSSNEERQLALVALFLGPVCGEAMAQDKC
jgi:hypothetical protein